MPSQKKHQSQWNYFLNREDFRAVRELEQNQCDGDYREANPAVVENCTRKTRTWYLVLPGLSCLGSLQAFTLPGSAITKTELSALFLLLVMLLLTCILIFLLKAESLFLIYKVWKNWKLHSAHLSPQNTRMHTQRQREQRVKRTVYTARSTRTYSLAFTASHGLYIQ